MPTIEQANAWYPENDTVHGFDHVLRVYRLAERLADEEGADLEIVRTAVLLHDAAPPGDYNPQSGEEMNGRDTHHLTSAEFAAVVLQAEGWPEARIAAVQHCIRAHRFRDEREPPSSREAQVLFDADKLDAIGAIGAARAVAYAAKAGQPILARPSETFRKTGQKEPGEPHSAYHEFIFKLSVLKERMYTETGRKLAEERHSIMVTIFDRMLDEAQGNQ